jgi:hypothetical protein
MTIVFNKIDPFDKILQIENQKYIISPIKAKKIPIPIEVLEQIIKVSIQIMINTYQ